MDKKYQDIYYKNNKSGEYVFVLREIVIRNMSFKDTYIEIHYIEITPTTLSYGAIIKTIIIPKLQGYSLIID